jgi:hypothetical protein
MLAGIVYYVRVLVVETLLLAAQREEQTDNNCDCFLEKQKKYLANRLYSLISEIISLLAYSKYIRLNAGNLGNAN